MKKIFLTLTLGFSLSLTAFGDIYYNRGYYPNYTYRYDCNPYYRGNYYPPVYSSRYNYIQANMTNASRIRRLQRMKKIKRKKTRYVAWSLGNRNNGTMTGYSVPITSNSIYDILPLNRTNQKNRPNSITCDTDLWSNPTSDSVKYSNGKSFATDRQTGAKAGVTIIYD